MDITNDGLLAAFDVAADGTAREIGWHEIDAPVPDGAWRWLHFHREAPRAQAWLLDGEVPPNAVAWALMAEDTRPRFTELEGGDVIFLRGVNLNRDSEPEDMISLRLSVSGTHVVSVALRRLKSVDEMIEAIRQGDAPASTGLFVERIVKALRLRVEPVLDELQEIVEAHELDALRDTGTPDAETRAAFTDAQQDAIILRRHLQPQVAAIRATLHHHPEWLHSEEALREEAEGYDRVVEDLDNLRERAAVLRDEIRTRQGERMNEIMLVLSVVSVIFLPITFVTGLLGMNVGGLPLADNGNGFWLVCAFLTLNAALTGWLVWRMLRRSR